MALNNLTNLIQLLYHKVVMNIDYLNKLTAK